ncbi:hypothetical protein DYB31_010268, partial [Aphanomyces astaci]
GASVPLPADNDPSDVRNDTDMGSDGGYGRTAPQVLNAPAHPAAADNFGLDQGRKTHFIREYQKYLGQINALRCNGSRPFAMPVSACMDPFSKRRIALFDFSPVHNSITNDEWVAWFKSAFEEDPQDLDVLKQRLQRAIRFDTKIVDT